VETADIVDPNLRNCDDVHDSRLTSELSAARANVSTWHFIPPACAPAIC
jgi:hypothetical protein